MDNHPEQPLPADTPGWFIALIVGIGLIAIVFLAISVNTQEMKVGLLNGNGDHSTENVSE